MAKFTTIFRCKWLGDDSKTLGEIADRLEAEAAYLREVEAAGVKLDDPMCDDYAFLSTEDPVVAEKYGLQEDDEEECCDDEECCCHEENEEE